MSAKNRPRSSPSRAPRAGSAARSRTRSPSAVRTSGCSREAGGARRRQSRRSSPSVAGRWRCRPTWPTTSRSRRRQRRVEEQLRRRSTSGSTSRWRPCSRAFIDTEPEEFKRATEVTYLGTVYGTMAALKRMSARDRGKIVQVGSALAYRAIPLQAAYCGSKFGIRGFTDTIRTELLHDKSKVQITMVQLPGVNTTQFNWCRSKLPKHPMPVPADLSAGDPSRGGLLGCAPPPPRAVGRLQRGGGDPRQQARAELRRLVSGEDRLQRPADPGHARRTASAPATCTSRSKAWPPRTGSSMPRPRPAVPSSGRRPTVASARRRAGRNRRRGRHGARRLAR